MTKTLAGGCQCGAVRYEIKGEPLFAAICHCSMCRRANAAPMVAWAMFAAGEVTFTAGTEAVYESSPGSRRGFCGACGTQISFTADNMEGLIDITICSLDDPSQISPTLHYWTSRRLEWVQFADGLPAFADAPDWPD
jgi:hypothetical protein